MTHNLSGDLHDPDLFDEGHQGQYEYEEGDLGKSASGYLVIDENPHRDQSAQAMAGGDERRSNGHEWGADDGGHLIGARFGGAAGEENLAAQARNLNRSGYKKMENEWANHIAADDKVFVHVETLGGDRPTAYMGYAIYEHPDGTRDYETFSFNNEGKDQVASWEQELDEWEAEHPEEAQELYGSYYEGDTGLDPQQELTADEHEYSIDEDEGVVTTVSYDYGGDEYLGDAAEDLSAISSDSQSQEQGTTTDMDDSMDY